jgi:hypothetical protein
MLVLPFFLVVVFIEKKNDELLKDKEVEGAFSGEGEEDF